MPELNYSLTKNCGREELLMLYTANTTVEACGEFQLFTTTWRLAPSNHNVGSACVRHLTLTITSGLADLNSLPLQNRKERR